MKASPLDRELGYLRFCGIASFRFYAALYCNVLKLLLSLGDGSLTIVGLLLILILRRTLSSVLSSQNKRLEARRDNGCRRVGVIQNNDHKYFLYKVVKMVIFEYPTRQFNDT